MNDTVITTTSPNELTDSSGRKLVLRELEVLEEARIVRLCGEASSNQGYMMGYVFTSVAVSSIDGDPVPIPTTEREIEFTIKRVGRAGIAAVQAHLMTKYEAARDAQSKGTQEVKN